MAVNRALGTLSGPFYFINKAGVILLPMDEANARFLESSYRRRGFELRQANTLREVEKLERQLQDQESSQIEYELQHDENICADGREKVRSSLYQRMISSATSEYEREFIRLYLQLRPEKREKYRQRWLERQSYFEALHFDSGTKHLQDKVDSIEVGGKR